MDLGYILQSGEDRVGEVVLGKVEMKNERYRHSFKQEDEVL